MRWRRGPHRRHHRGSRADPMSATPPPGG
ncbi:galactose-1-phosphate uridylyltransferase, partial [Klebsiella pneumoniae]